jgi:hypothetical protein
MISRRNFLKMLSAGAVFLSTSASIAKAKYNKSVIFLTDFGGIVKAPIKGTTNKLDEAKNLIEAGGLVHPRGTGHSVMGRSMKDHALIYTPEEHDISFKNEVVYASAATTLLDIDHYLEEFGFMLPRHRTIALSA